MLFDLKGKRRRTVQVTYVGLALLMAIGLVGAGVGSGTSGGLFDLFKGGGSGGSGNTVVDKRIAAAEKALRVNPRDRAAMESLVRSHYQLASADTNPNTGAFGKDGKKELVKASAAWKRYLASNPKKPDDSLASVMVTAYSPEGLSQAANAAEAAEVLADVRNNAQAYLQLVQYAALAGQTRKADLAGEQAIKLAPKSQRGKVREAVKKAKSVGSTKGAPGSQPGTQP